MGRFQDVGPLWRGLSSDEMASSEEAATMEDESGPSGLKGHIHAWLDPVGSSLSLTSDVSSQIGQLRQQTRTAARLLAVFSLLVLADFMTFLMTDLNPGLLVPVGGEFELPWRILAGLAIIVSFLAYLALVEISRFLNVFQARYAIVLSLVSAPPPQIPAGPDAASRFKKYLTGRGCAIGGLEGGKMGFDIVCTPAKCGGGVSTDTVKRGKKGGDACRAILLARVIKETPSPEAVKSFSRAVSSALPKLGGLEACFIRPVLLWDSQGGESPVIPDEVAEYILDNPICIGQGPGSGEAKVHVQIVIDEGEMYNFFPLVAEEL